MKVQNYRLIEEIGSGAFSTVYKAIDERDGKFYAVKSMRQIPQNEEKAIRQQIALLKSIQEKQLGNVVKYITDFNHNNKWYIVFQYCAKGDLQKFIKKFGKMPEIFAKNFASSVISALSVIHSKNIAHRDLKLSNILISDDYNFKIADFGMAKTQQNGLLQSFCGTPYAMAPEVLKRQSYSTKCDTWSLGIMLYQIIFGRLPFDGKKYGGGIFALSNSVLNDEPSYANAQTRITDQCEQFLKQCLKKNPNHRPTMKQLQNHGWLKVGVGSTFRKDIFKNSFEESDLNKEVEGRIKKILFLSVQEHIKRIIKQFTLQHSEIEKYLRSFDTYFSDDKNIKWYMNLMIVKILKQLAHLPIKIFIAQKIFTVKLNKIQSFRNHLTNLEGLLQDSISKLKQMKNKQKMELEPQLIQFVVNHAESCLSIDEYFPEKINLLKYLATLPLYLPEGLKIKIKYQFNESSVKPEQLFEEMISKITEEQVIKFANQRCEQQDEKNWIVEHQILKRLRDGDVFGIGQFISKIIDINSKRELEYD